MTTAAVHWTAFRRLSSIEGLPDVHFYMFASARRDDGTWKRATPLYIGMSYHTEISKRIQQDHAAYRWLHEHAARAASGRELVVAVAELAKTSQSRVTEALVKDVESMLICGIKPKYNVRNKTTYNGRPLVVTTTGAASVVFKSPLVCCMPHYRAIARGEAIPNDDPADHRR